MIRWLRIAAVGSFILAIAGLGVCVGLFLVANNDWIALRVPPWLAPYVTDPEWEMWLPALLSGWIVMAISVGALICGSLFYVWRRRQYESYISRLERELTGLRNLPLRKPAPLEDIPETPSEVAAQVLADLEGGGDLVDETVGTASSNRRRPTRAASSMGGD